MTDQEKRPPGPYDLQEEAAAAQRIVEIVTDWQDVTLVPHRFGAVGFLLGGKEFGHYHAGGLLDVPLPKKMRDVLIEERKAVAHRYAPNSGWITFHIRAEQDAGPALWLLRLSYLYRSMMYDGGGVAFDQVEAELTRLQPASALCEFFAEVRQKRKRPALRSETLARLRQGNRRT